MYLIQKIIHFGNFGTIEENNNIENFDNIAFTDDYICFTGGKNIKITDYDGNIINNELYTAENNENILSIISVVSNKLQIYTDLNEENIKIIDFETSTIEDTENIFYDIIKIK